MSSYVARAKAFGDLKFHIVMAKTISDLMSMPRTVALVAGGVVPVVIFALAWRGIFQEGSMSLEMEKSLLVGYFIIISFLWMAGVYLIYLIIGTSGLELVDRERDKGTLLLMVSKPISRLQILLGKFIALVLTTMLLEAIILLASVIAFWALLGLDPDIVAALLGLIPWILLFSLLVTLAFSAISIAISTLVTSYLARNAILLIIVATVFLSGLVIRVQWPDSYENYRLYYIDASYNLGNAYVPLMERAETGRLLPVFQALLGITTGAYKASTEVLLASFLGGEAFDQDIGAMPPALERTGYVSPAFSMILSLVATVAAFWGASLAFNRKEVQ